ncbi:MAG TPA: myxococcus cysteine-rich repeat containing protein [bacterium]|nr:myxococcus cysteine-rich repeat containing protein [bacterium]
MRLLTHVGGAALSFAIVTSAFAPALEAQEVGSNDFRISFMGPNGDSNFGAGNPSVTYNPNAREFYVVWRGDDNTAPLVNNEFEIFGVRLDESGNPIGSETRLSFQGPDGDTNYAAVDPVVVYNSVENEYFAVWAGDDDTGPLVSGEQEVYGQRVDAATGNPILGNIRISFMDPDGDDNFTVAVPSAAYNSTGNEYLVVWSGNSDSPPLDGDGIEIAGQRVGADGSLQGSVLQISDMGPAGDLNYLAASPSVAYNASDDEYLVVWYGDDQAAPLGNNEFEIFGQRLKASDGSPLGTNDFRISEAGGPNGSTTFRALTPKAAWNSVDDQYLVAWTGERNEAPFVDEEYEVFGQVLDASGGVVKNDFRISSMGPDGNANYRAACGGVGYNPNSNEYLVVWLGDDDTDPLIDEEFEAFVQRVSADGTLEGGNTRISDMGPDDTAAFAVNNTAITPVSTDLGFLIVWEGDDDTAPLVDGESEIFGQFFVSPGCGNGLVESGEACDDGNTADGDGCSAACADEGGSTSGATAGGSTAGSTAGTAGTAGTSGSGDSGGGCSLILPPKNFASLVDEIRISDMGPDGDMGFGTFTSAAAYNSVSNEFLVVWKGFDDSVPSNDFFGQRLDAATGAEIGDNDFHLNQTVPNFDIGQFPALAYNSTDNQYLLVWQSFEFGPSGAEIFGQILDAEGKPVGGNFQVSQMEIGPGFETIYQAFLPKVAYNSVNNEYLVVWFGDAEAPPLTDNEFEIYGQRLSAAGAPVGDDDFRISQAGNDGNALQTARAPDVAYNPDRNEYFVVWDANHLLVPGGFEREIYGQRLAGDTGAAVGSNDFRISTAGPSGDSQFSAIFPSVAYNPVAGEYLVVWTGDDDEEPLVDNELEVFGQRIDAATEDQVGENDFRISDAGPDGETNFGVNSAKVVYNRASNEYLVIWVGDDDIDPLVDDESEIFGQRLAGATAEEIGTNDFRITHIGPDGNTDFFINSTAIAVNVTDNRSLVAWDGLNTIGDLFVPEFEVFGAFFDATAEADAPVCGNGAVESGEACDDGNTADGDGCSASCATETSEDDSGGGCSLIRE